MKRLTPLVLLAFGIGCLLAPLAWAAAARDAHPVVDQSPSAPLANAISTVTGVAISPLLGTSALGAFRWVMAKDDAARAALPWFAQPKFWIPALLVVLICALKDSVGPAVPPLLKKPLDALEVVENKFSGLIAAGAVVPLAMDALSRLLAQPSATAGASIAPSGLAMIQVIGVNWAPALDVLTVPFGIAIFALVWMASHAINVLVLLSPWGGIDAALKGTRTALLGLLTLTATINPWLGALLSLLVIVVAYFVAGWAFRLTVFGAIFSWDFFTGRRGRFAPTAGANAMFAGSALGGVPIRTYGRLVRRESELIFVYRPWLLFRARSIAVPDAVGAMTVGSGLIFPVVWGSAGTLFTLPPRYRGHEAQLVDRYGFGGGVRPAGLRKAWSSFKELVGRPAGAPVPAAMV